MQRLTGEYFVKLDAKNRFRLPSQILRALGDDRHQFVINRGFERHLSIYPKVAWDAITEKLDNLSMFNAKQRKFQRYFYRGATELTLDGSDRLLLPKSLQEYAGIGKELVIAGVRDRLEIWSREEYQKMCDEEPEDFSDLADDVTGSIDIDI